MELSKKIIRKLADLEQESRGILSVYLDLSGRWEAAESFLSSSASRLERTLEGEEAEYLEVAMDLIGEEIGRLKGRAMSAPGLAMFVSPDHGVLRSVELPSPPANLLTLDREAAIFQLALQLDEFEPVGVIVVDASGARVLVAAGEVSQDLGSYRANIHHLCKVGGWSQMRYQRRRDKQVKAAAIEVVKMAQQVFEEQGVARVFIAGRERMMTAVEDEMPQAFRDRVVGRLAWDLKAGDDRLIEEARPIFEEAERAQEGELLERFRGEIKRGGLAAAGPDEVRTALEWGAVDVLLLGPECGAEEREELASMATTTSAHVEIVPQGGPLLSKHGGAGAILRFPVQSAHASDSIEPSTSV
jgi:peptide chain release factor subunit 1